LLRYCCGRYIPLKRRPVPILGIRGSVARKIKIDFYTVEVPAPAKLDEIFKEIASSPLGPARNATIHDAPVRLQSGGTLRDKFCEGDLIRIQMDGLPTDAGLDGSAKRIAMPDDHGLGHETAFLFYKPWNLLLLQRNRSGVSPSALARYIENKGGLESPIEIVPVPLQYALGKLNRMKRNRRIRVKLAAAKRIPKWKTDNRAVQSAVNLLGSMHAPAQSRPVLDLTMSIDGPRYESMKHDKFVRTAKAFLKIPNNEAVVERLDISGSETDDGKMELLHYLDFVLVDEQPVKSEQRSVPYHQRAAAIRKAFNKHTDQLKKIFAP
jgi:hypothetical protein